MADPAPRMREAVLRHFPAHVHALTVVSDRDGLLADEDVAGVLADRGFTLVAEDDPVMLRVRIEELRPWTPERPVIVVTAGDVRSLPFDLWRQGHHVTLSLHDHFPRLAYPIVKALTPAQRARLAGAGEPMATLGEASSIDFILRQAFDLAAFDLTNPAGLVGWLNHHHARNETLPVRLRDALLTQVRAEPRLREIELDLGVLIDDREAYDHFVRAQWDTFVRRSTGASIAETAAPYILHFERETDLQDDVAGLLRTGTIAPVRVGDPGLLPAWARPGVLAVTDDSQARRIEALTAALAERLDGADAERRWDDWQAIAREWAELTVLRVDAEPASAAMADIARLEATLDPAFLAWLRRRYAALGGQKLPQPHHVHHIPLWLAGERERAPQRRVALIVIDGLSLADWFVIAPAWRRRHPGWKLDEQLALAQVPTITAISRQALVSGRRPGQFAASIGTNAKEPHLWRQFWLEAGLDERAITADRLNLDAPGLPAPPPGHVRALYWVTGAIDEIVHGVTLGTRDLVASVRLWLDRQSPRLEMAIEALLDGGFTVTIASDHGHVEARGTGARSEGLAVATRGKRARLYRDRLLAHNAHAALPGTVLWGDDGLLPPELWAVMPAGRTAFAPMDDTVVTHGGVTIDEAVVPLVTIRLDA